MAATASKRRRWMYLALLGLVLLAVVGLATGAFGGDSNGKDRPLSRQEKEAQRVERRLARHPNDPRLLRATIEAWINAGNQHISNISTATKPSTAAIREDFKASFRAWNRYLEQTDGYAGGDFAELVGRAYFNLLELGSRNVPEIEANLAGAAQALGIAGERKPTFYTLSDTAIYEYFNGEFAAGDKTAKAAADDTATKREYRVVVGQLGGYRKRAVYFRGQLRRAREELAETGEEQLEEPLKMYSSASNINRDDPRTPGPT